MMFGGIRRSLRLLILNFGCVFAHSAVAQLPDTDHLAPIHNMAPVVSSESLTAVDDRPTPVATGKDVQPTGAITMTQSVYEPVVEDAAVIEASPVQQIGGCSDCGAVDSCSCSNSASDESRAPAKRPRALAPSHCSGCCRIVGCQGGCKQKRLSYFFEFLYLRTRNTDVAYAVPIDGPIAPIDGNGVQIGPAAVVGLDHEGDDNYRFGGSLLLNDGAQIGGRYTTFENQAMSQAFIAAPDVLRAEVTHPLGDNVAVDSLRASADYEVEFELADLFYQAHLFCNNRTIVDYVLGLRYAEINQRLNAEYLTTGVTSVHTDVEFYGFGPRIGLDLDHRIGNLGLSVYSRGDATFIPGTARGFYRQVDAFAGPQVDTSWESGCVMTQLDFEIGLGWWYSNCLNISAGYLVSAWLNTATTNEFIDAVQTNDFNSIEGDGLTFEGLVVRADLRF